MKVKGDASPYDGNLVYWSSRMGKNLGVPKNVATLLKGQKGFLRLLQIVFHRRIGAGSRPHHS